MSQRLFTFSGSIVVLNLWVKSTTMLHDTGYFKGVRNVSIAYQTWLPEGETKAAILLLHGLGEHSSRYLDLVNRLLPLGYAIYSLDHIGHGKSEGVRKHVDTFEDFTSTLDIYLEQVKRGVGDKPLFLFGHSMGGLIAANFLLDNQAHFSGAILSAPALKISDDVPALKIIIGKILSFIAPKVGIIPINPNKISRDPQVIAAYLDDPLIHKGNTSARLAFELFKAMQHVHDNAKQIKLPLLILQGTDDVIVHPEGAQTFFDATASLDKNLKLYQGLYHEVFNELEKEQVFSDFIQWLGARTIDTT